jgi:hypothetical protein
MPQQANADQKGIAEGLKNRVQQSAAIAAMRDNEEHPPTAPTSSPYASTPRERAAHQKPAPTGEKEMYNKAVDWAKPLGEKGPKVYDKGGKVTVNPDDGKHEVAILKDGERVLTPEQNKDWEHAKSLGGVSGKAPTTLPIGGKTVRDANDVTSDMTPKKVYDNGGVVGEHSSEERAHFHRAMSHLHTGGLHRALGVAEDKPLSMEQKKHAAASSNPHMAAMGRLAVAMHGWRGQKGSK